MNSSDNKIAELEDLIRLAEEVAHEIDTTKEKVIKSTYNAIAVIFGLIVLCFLGFKYYQIQDLAFRNTYSIIVTTFSFIIIILLGLILFRFLHTVTNMRESIKNENLILGDLLDMTHSYKQVVYRDMSAVKKAVIDMRLSRIEFNKQIPNTVQLIKKEKVATVQN